MDIKHEVEVGRENLDKLISALTDKGTITSGEDQGKLLKSLKEAFNKLEKLTLQDNAGLEEGEARTATLEDHRYHQHQPLLGLNSSNSSQLGTSATPFPTKQLGHK